MPRPFSKKETLAQLVCEPATLDDVDRLTAFERKVADPRVYGPPLDAQGARQEITKSTFFFVKRGGMILGTAAYRVRSDRSVYISKVAVDPAYRRQGIARAAMLLILEKCKGTHRMDLVTHPENEPALQLYRSLGFKVEFRQENYFRDGEPRLVLSLTRPLL